MTSWRPSPAERRAAAAGRPGQAGFSLLELTLALLIASLALGGMINPLGLLLEGRQRAAAVKELERAKEALMGFAMINGYLPCPTLVADPGAADYGLAPPACAAAPAAEGYLPWRTLGLPEVDPWGAPRQAAADPFNGYWRYRVDRSFSNAADPFTLDRAATDNLAVRDERGGLLTAPTESPAAIIYSTGANLLPDGANADFESAPCGNATGYNPGGGTSCPDGEPLYQGGAPSDLVTAPFDDIVVWLSRPRLFYGMVTAGRLP